MEQVKEISIKSAYYCFDDIVRRFLLKLVKNIQEVPQDTLN